MDDQAADEVVKKVGKECETLDLASRKPNKLFLKLKFSKSLVHWSQHICSVCSKGFISGKALGGHMRIHMKYSKNGRHGKISKLQPRNIAEAKNRISKITVLPKATGGAVDLPFSDQDKEKVSCCICNKDFRSMKSLFGHMRNHPERGWRGIRPPPSEKNSCCWSISENDKALEFNQISCAPEKGLVSGSDLVRSLPKRTNTAKRCGKFTSDENEIPEAAYCLLKLARGDSFDLGQSSAGYQRKYPQTDKLTMDYKTRPWGLVNKASAEEKQGNVLDKEMGIERKGKATLKTESDQERVRSECKRGDSYSPGEEKKIGMADSIIIESNRWFDQFQKFPMKPSGEEGDPLAMEGRCRIFPSSQTPGSCPKNPRGGLSQAPLNETAASPAEDKQLHSKTLFPKAASQFRTPKILDFDLNEPYVAPDGEAAAYRNLDQPIDQVM